MSKTTIYLFFALMLTIISINAQNNKLKILVIINGENNLRVELNKTPFTGGGILGVLISKGIQDESNDRNSEELHKLHKGFTEYKYKHAENISANMTSNNNNLEITSINKKDALKYFSSPLDLKLDYEKLIEDGWKSVIVIDEKLGFFRSQVNNENKYNIYLSSEVFVYDIENKKKLGSFNTLNQKVDKVYNESEIKKDKSILPENYIHIYKNVDNSIYFRLLGSDYLHKMATNQNLINIFPSVKTALKKYSKSFVFTAPEIEGWRGFNSGNDLLFINAPRKDKTVFAITSEIDFAIEELGQKDLTSDEYAAIVIKRLIDRNLEINTTEEIPSLNINKDWIVYMINVPNGKNIIIQKRINNYFVTHYIAIVKEDYKLLINKYKSDIENFINNFTIFLKPSN